MSTQKIKILLVDDHPVLREGLKTVLELKGQFQIVGEAESGVKACELVPIANPDIVLMDICMPEMDGIKASKIIKKQFPQTRILLLTMHDDAKYILEALEIGVEGYLLKMSEMDKVINAINLIIEDETYFDPRITRSLIRKDQIAENTNTSDKIIDKFSLTSREVEIAQLIVGGCSTKQMAEKLFISANTVYNHRRNIFHKLNINRVGELINFAIKQSIFLDNDTK
jgi:two-component system response regulator DegU